MNREISPGFLSYLADGTEGFMRFYIGFDDTDILDADRGTGKLVRWYGGRLPEDCVLYGVVRHQLLVDPRIPYTSHNSSACAIVDVPSLDYRERLISLAVEHLEEHFLQGSDPGLCVAAEGDSALPALAEHGRLCAAQVMNQVSAFSAAEGVHLSAHGGTGDGVIGAAAAVGLSWFGWSGRFIEKGELRDLSDPVMVGDLQMAGIRVVSVDRNALLPSVDDRVLGGGWLRPRLWGGQAVLPVRPEGSGCWRALGEKGGHDGNQQQANLLKTKIY